jgi:transcription initiation factor TFIIH subunit 4
MTALNASLGSGATGSFGVPGEADDKRAPVTIKTLDGLALERWEVQPYSFDHINSMIMLHHFRLFCISWCHLGQAKTLRSPLRVFCTCCREAVLWLRPSMLFIARQFISPFSEKKHSGSVLSITSAGFQFLLHSPHAQLWDLLLQYLHMAEVSARRTLRLLIVRPHRILRNARWIWSKFSVFSSCCQPWSLVGLVLCRLPSWFSRAFQEYSTDHLSATQKAMLEDLRDYGLVWQRKVRRFNVVWLFQFIITIDVISTLQPYPPCHYSDIIIAPAANVNWRKR